jgi:hypothetical protein
MLDAFVRAGLLALMLALACARLQANDWFVAPGGTPSGSGSYSRPYDIATALSGLVGQPGDTFWLRGGDYYLGHLNSSVQGEPDRPVTYRQVHGETARIDGSLTLFDSAGYLVLRDLVLYSSDANRVSSQTNAGFNPTDIAPLTGIACYVPNVSLIDLVIHDQTRHGIYLVESATNTLVYGCILYNNGWVSPDNAEGHGIYIQGNVGTRVAANNIIFNNSGAGVHVYDNRSGLTLGGVTLDGNVAFGAGSIQHVRPYRDWIAGVDSPALYADGIVLGNNMGYLPPGETIQPELQIGRDNVNGSVVLTNNYMPLGLLMNNWTNATVSGNLFAPSSTSYLVELSQTLTSLNADWDDNTYVSDPSGQAILLNSQPYSFSGWQATTGYDDDSTLMIGALSGTQVFVMPNAYEKGRANIVVYNWDNSPSVSVDVTSVLPMNSRFFVINAQDPDAPPVLSGIYSGQRLVLPMANLTVAQVNGPANGPLSAPPPTGPAFNVFVLVPVRDPLQLKWAGSSVQVFWNFEVGSDALQATSQVADPASWTYSTAAVAIVGDQFMITEPSTSDSKFYRLLPH